MLTVSAPPGAITTFASDPPARIEPPSTRNLFIVGAFERGGVAQFTSPAGLRSALGARVNYSVAPDEAAAALAESRSAQSRAAPVTASRVVGPAAAAASVVLDTKLKVAASSPGAWGNGLTAAIDDPTSTTRRLIVAAAGGSALLVSPEVSSMTELVAWVAAQPSAIVTCSIVAPGLPVAAAAAPLVGGDDDRTHMTTANWAQALDRLDPRYGPGRLIICSADRAVHGKALEHCANTGRRVELTLPPEVTEPQAIEHRLELEADYPDDSWRGNLWASWAFSTPIGGEPERLVSWAAIQAGITSRVEAANGLGAAPFGTTRGVSQTANRLQREWTSRPRVPGAGEVERLYAGGVNVAQDDGRGSLCSLGYKSVSTAELNSDGQSADTWMRLEWVGQKIVNSKVGEPPTRKTLASLFGDLNAAGETFADDGALNTDDDAGFKPLVDEVNDADSLARREIHGGFRFKSAGSTDWAELQFTGVATKDQI